MADRRQPDLEAIVQQGLPQVDARLAVRAEGAIGRLRGLRDAARLTASYERRTQLVHDAWEVVGPLYEELEPRSQDPALLPLLHALDVALMDVVDNPHAGRLVTIDRTEPRRGDIHRDRKGDDGCCMTRIVLRNLLAVSARVTASGALGVTTTRVFRPGDRRTLSRKELPREGEPEPDDETPAGGGGVTIRGGLGRCVRIDVEIENEAHEWVNIMSREVCCDQQRTGDILNTTPPPPPPTATTRERPSPVLEIVRIDAERPCPPGAAEVAPGGQHGYDVRECPGLNVPGKGHFVGGHVFLLFRPPDTCRRFCFIQAVKRTITVDGAVVRGASRDWGLDLLAGQPRRPGCYAYQKDQPGGGRVLNDSPGLVNPWGAIRLEDGRIFRPRPGQRLVGEWSFRTFAVCLDPVQVYGQFSWSMRIELTVPAGPPPNGGSVPGVDITLPAPVFTPRDQMTQADTDLFTQVVQ